MPPALPGALPALAAAVLAAAMPNAPAAAQSPPTSTPPAATPTTAFDLASYRWRSRVLVLLAPSPTSAAYRAQRAALDDESAALAARDIVVASAFEDGTGTVDGRALPAGAASALRRRYAAERGRLGVVLVGKDGGAKLRETGPVAPGELFALVDRMPMGRVEAAAHRRSP